MVYPQNGNVTLWMEWLTLSLCFLRFFPFWMIQTQHPHVFFQSPRKPAVDEAARAEGALFFVVKIVRTSKLGLFCGDNNPPSFGGSTMLNSYLLMDQTVISLWLPTQKGHVYMFTDEIQCPFGHGAWWVDDTIHPWNPIWTRKDDFVHY